MEGSMWLESGNQPVDVGIRGLGVVIEVGLDADPARRQPGTVQGLANQVNHFPFPTRWK